MSLLSSPLPRAGWVKYQQTPSAIKSDYGGQLWLNNDYEDQVYEMRGFRNEHVFMRPEKDLVIAQLAMPQLTYAGWSKRKFLDAMFACVA